ncbi:hypothetical protein CF319_g4824 [Tilletia indica]|nr:hypothetical protein CF319_g4824 [Tilletia indica]
MAPSGMNFGTQHGRCLLCPQKVSSLAVLCASCARITSGTSPCFILLGANDDMHSQILKNFLATWKHPGPQPQVTAIHAILVDFQATMRFEHVRSSNNLPQETRLYREYWIVEQGFRHPRPSGIRPTNAGGWDRFGKAIYSTPVSSKAADYENKRNATSRNRDRVRHVMLARVATGRMEVVHQDQPMRRDASKGFDSIRAPGGSAVNYTEYAVYKDYGALPIYIISFRGGF